VTRALLAVLVDVRPRGVRILGLWVLALAVLPVTLVVDGIIAIGHTLAQRRVLARRSTRCPAGHVVDLVGVFRCPACGLTEENHAFAPCTACGATAAAVTCACTRSVRNPLWRPELS
jgi:hypothetical protein